MRARPHVKRALTSTAALLLAAAGTVLAGYVLVVQVGGAIVSGAVRAVVLLPRAIIWIAGALQEGVTGWAIAGRAASVVGDALSVPLVTLSFIALELVGAAALFALATLLRTQRTAPGAEETHQ